VTSGFALYFALYSVPLALLLRPLLGFPQELGHSTAREPLRLGPRSYFAQTPVQLYREVRLSLGQA
jgi:hypothetical protein